GGERASRRRRVHRRLGLSDAVGARRQRKEGLMAEPFLGEIRMMSFNFPPKGWALANGQTLPINQNQALFSLFGTMYGGNGQTTFAIPNLQGRTPIHVGGQFNNQGEAGGEISHTLNISELPTHNHFAKGNNGTATASDPTNAFW